MLLKYTLKNIFQKKGRLFIILFCMVIACFAAFMAADFMKSINSVLEGQVAGSFGTSDYLIMYKRNGGISDELFTDVPEVKYVSRKNTSKREVTRDEKLYCFALTDTVEINAFTDWEKAKELKLLKDEAVPKENGTITINQAYSDKYGYKVGDTILLRDIEEEEQSFVVSNVFPNTKGEKKELRGYITEEDMVMLTGSVNSYAAYADVEDDQRDEFEKQMEEKHPNVTLTPLYSSDSFQEDLDRITGVFYLVFIMLFLLVVFVTVSFTEKIINERMSVIGTLRSVGVSMRKTTFILLFENVMYALLGSVIGFILYLIARAVLLSVFMTDGTTQIEPINPLLIVLVFLGAAMVQILIPALEMLKAVKTSIRDIIFETKDSEYRLSNKKTILGAVCIVAGFVLGMVMNVLYVTMISMVIVVAGVALVLPFILKKVSQLMAGIFGKSRKPVAELASIEAGSKKHNFGSAILAVASILVTAIIFIAGQSLVVSFSQPKYNCDVVVSEAAMKTSKYDFINEIEGVESVDVRYIVDSMMNDVGYGDGKVSGFTVMSMTDPTTYKGMGDLPESLEDNEVILNVSAANKLGVSEGDTVSLTFHISEIFPMERELVVKQVSKQSEFMSPPTIIINPEQYIEIYVDQPAEVLIRANDPVAVKEELEKNLTSGEEVRTITSITAEIQRSNRSIVGILTGVVIASVILTLVGISGNQVIGFASRKKEYAMLHSCACPLGKIIRMIWIENGLVFGVAGIVAYIMSFPMAILLSKAFVQADLGVAIKTNYLMLLGYMVVLWGITMLTALTPIKNLKKMNTSAELKYE